MNISTEKQLNPGDLVCSYKTGVIGTLLWSDPDDVSTDKQEQLVLRKNEIGLVLAVVKYKHKKYSEIVMVLHPSGYAGWCHLVFLELAHR